MIVALQTERIRTVDQVRAFLEGSEPVDYFPQDRDDAYEFVRRTLVRVGYALCANCRCCPIEVSTIAPNVTTPLLTPHKKKSHVYL